jgi:hypothetical protein
VEDVDPGAPDRRVEFPGGGEDRVADRLGLEATERCVGDKLVEWIGVVGPGGGRGS